LLGALQTPTYLIRQLKPFLALYLRLHLESLFAVTALISR
jgi:hypothetical protein